MTEAVGAAHSGVVDFGRGDSAGGARGAYRSAHLPLAAN